VIVLRITTRSYSTLNTATDILGTDTLTFPSRIDSTFPSRSCTNPIAFDSGVACRSRLIVFTSCVDGKLIILDAVISPQPGPDFKKMLDFEMMLMPGGRERTEAEFRELLARAGFKLARIIPTKPMVAVIEAAVV